jgi:hypothetical protein
MNYVLLPQSDPFYASLLNLPNLTHIITPHLNHPTHLSHLKKLFLPYEASYPAARTCLPIALNRLILNLKDKYVFRKKLSAIFPHFFFVKIDLDDLDHFKFEYFKKDRYLVKPKLGFMSAGARVFDHHTDLSALKNDIKDELGFVYNSHG